MARRSLFSLPTLLCGAFLLTALSPLALASSDIKLTFHNKLVDGKITWVPEPADVKIKAGSIVNVQLINHLDTPHGFYLPKLSDPLVVPGKIAGQAKPKLSFSFQASEETGTYDYQCHMHPAHVGGSFHILK